MSNTVKCASCNIVIDELLAYIQNKVSVADEASLVKICASAFTSEQIQRSKTLLLESMSTDVPSTARKGKGKENRVLNDIIAIFKTEPDALPVFVARDLNKLPPITFDHLDVSKLLKDLILVQNEIKNIKSSYVTQDELQDLRTKYDLISLSTNLPAKKGAYCSMEGGSEKLPRYEVSATRVSENNDNAASEPSGNDESLLPLSAGTCMSVAQLSETTRNTAPLPSTLSQSYASVVAQQNNNDKNDDGYTLVQYKKKRNNKFKGSIGSVVVESTEKFRSADRKTPMFITNVDKATLESDITDYILKKTGESVNLERINIKRQCEHKAYKFIVSQSKLHMFLNEKVWPEGIIFRRFINYRPKRNNETLVHGTHNTNNV